MISITKKRNVVELTVEYKLEVIKDNKLIYSASVSIGTEGMFFQVEENRDKLAKRQLMNMLLDDISTEVADELYDLIPVYEE